MSPQEPNELLLKFRSDERISTLRRRGDVRQERRVCTAHGHCDPCGSPDRDDTSDLLSSLLPPATRASRWVVPPLVPGLKAGSTDLAPPRRRSERPNSSPSPSGR